MSERTASRWKVVGLLLAIVAIFALCLALAPKPSGDGESFGGTDAAVTEVLEEQGVEPWFSSVFQPGSSEIESGLFALQAALGGGVLGYALGNLRGRRSARRPAPVVPEQVDDGARERP
ncbi:energy-coupling factor ABC transporter substrate-binding protein [Luteococcus peritonei]|uniref:Cobalt transport protein CbiN n=1 Tax=Luteococcus peritonei TaxID=88874 RepID=A0ABW4RTN9_9ACTN